VRYSRVKIQVKCAPKILKNNTRFFEPCTQSLGHAHRAETATLRSQVFYFFDTHDSLFEYSVLRIILFYNIQNFPDFLFFYDRAFVVNRRPVFPIGEATGTGPDRCSEQPPGPDRPFSKFSCSLHAHRSIGYRNLKPKSLTDSVTRLMYLRVYDNRDTSHQHVPSSSLYYSLTHTQVHWLSQPQPPTSD
jgi:hypothetical protein